VTSVSEGFRSVYISYDNRQKVNSKIQAPNNKQIPNYKLINDQNNQTKNIQILRYSVISSFRDKESRK